MTISRRSLLLGGPALLGLWGCGTTSAKHRSNRPVHATSIVVHKADRRLELMQGDRVLKAFDIALGSDPVGPKRQEGDGKTPEGTYYIHRKKPDSAYHLAVGISYPSTVDVDRARAAGVPPGGNIFIHGQPSGITAGPASRATGRPAASPSRTARSRRSTPRSARGSPSSSVPDGQAPPGAIPSWSPFVP